jgi:hypothetical protein
MLIAAASVSVTSIWSPGASDAAKLCMSAGTLAVRALQSGSCRDATVVAGS